MQSLISRPVKRPEGEDKASGRALYVADLPKKDFLWGRYLLSDRPRARILSITLPPLPPGYSTVSGEDFPASGRAHIIKDDWPFFAEGEVNYIGEPILLLLGADAQVLHHLLNQIKVEYEDLPPVLTLEDSQNKKEIIFGRNNYFTEYKVIKGDPEGAFQKADRVFEGTYRTGAQEHIYMEPQGMLAEYDEGILTVYGSMQCPYYVKNALLPAFGFSEDRIRIIQTTTGGGFGGKEDFPSLIAGHATLGAYKTGKPVKIILDRHTDILMTPKRHPSKISIRTALDSQDRILGMEIQILIDGGAYEGLSSVVLQRALFASTGVYRIPNARITALALATNTVPNGAFRGFGAPQAYFAIETHMQELAQFIKQDPVKFKRSNCVDYGDSTLTGGTIKEPVMVDELLAKLKEISGLDPYKLPPREIKGSKTRAYGFSLFKHGCGFTGSGERDKIKAVVKLRRNADGTVEILIANTEIGQGAHTTLRKVVSETLGIPFSRIILNNPDTSRVPDSGPTVASRTAMIVGNLLHRAALKLKNQGTVGEEITVEERYAQPPEIVWDQETFVGDAYPAFSWGANLVEVEADPLTLEVQVKNFWGTYDIGVPLDERIAEGQMTGGISQGIGYATVEVLQNREGRFLQQTMTDCLIPTDKDSPEIKVAFVNNPCPYGPFGAKGAGELPLVGAAPAVASAISNALDLLVRELPATPESLIKESKRGEQK